MTINGAIELERAIGQIKALDEQAMNAARIRLDSLTKPPGSLGKLEAVAVQLAGITGEALPEPLAKAVVVMAGDHGVCEEGVSAFPQEVTAQMVSNFLNGGAAVNVLARQAGARVVCVDVGVKASFDHAGLVSRKIREGTGNIAQGPAMTRAEAIAAVVAGYDVAAELAASGVRAFATGEMGIGNTTPSAAILIALGGLEPTAAIGRGTGLDDDRLAHKRRVVERALQVNAADPNDPLDVLAKLGGLEIAGLVGVILGAAAHGSAVVVDGFISSAAALVASRVAPGCVPYMIASHLSMEQGHRAMLDAIGLAPMLHMDMRLGEGTGAVLAFHFLDAAVKLMREMATFESAGVSRR
ncbi:nicotinate-nucleotide--dimethylbenzimidazole phosphoribosyltransferase [Paenibacillaceae bacterium WGS1546]|uniref:nicotinate-nucleotide--dimethylbenzimidazole phosphoribosyltransferase n=1 Tax=Cohnella sp. WGS1546 TaxID=3366810 RepID=UPI00372D1A10